jgi:hypothetical protein
VSAPYIVPDGKYRNTCKSNQGGLMNLGAQLLQYTLSGITIGSLYAMVAIGFNIIYNATGIINLAQGDFVMLGGMTAVYFHNTLHMPLLVSHQLFKEPLYNNANNNHYRSLYSF